MLLSVYMYYINVYSIFKCLASNDVLCNVLIWANKKVSYLIFSYQDLLHLFLVFLHPISDFLGTGIGWGWRGGECLFYCFLTALLLWIMSSLYHSFFGFTEIFHQVCKVGHSMAQGSKWELMSKPTDKRKRRAHTNDQPPAKLGITRIQTWTTSHAHQRMVSSEVASRQRFRFQIWTTSGKEELTQRFNLLWTVASQGFNPDPPAMHTKGWLAQWQHHGIDKCKIRAYINTRPPWTLALQGFKPELPVEKNGLHKWLTFFELWRHKVSNLKHLPYTPKDG